MGFAALPALMASKVGMGFTAATGAMGALQAYGQGKYQSKMHDLQSKGETIASRQATIEGRSQALGIRQQANVHLGNILAQQAHLGQFGSPSGQAAYGEAKSIHEANRENARLSSGIEALGHDARAAMYGSMSDHARKQGFSNALGTLFSTGVDLAGQYGDFVDLKTELGGADVQVAKKARRKTTYRDDFLGYGPGGK